MLPLMAAIREAVDCHVAAVPVPYRTTAAEPSFQSLTDDACACSLPSDRPFPTALDPLQTNRYEIAEFATAVHALGINYLGVCCGNAPHFTRSMAEALGRTPPASRYSPDMSKHAFLGTNQKLKQSNRTYAEQL
jgi:betaine-homocysteine S-methyltransferase